jgi:high-affinity iron transporter
MGVVLSSCGGSGSASDITVTSQACAPSWQPVRTGPMTFEVSNETDDTMNIELLASGTPRVYGEIPTLGPGTTRPISVVLGPGKYAWQCASLAGDIATSNPEPVTGPAVAATPSYVPVTPDELDASVDTYRDSVTLGLVTLVADTERLQKLVDAGQIAAAKKQWLVAHLDYESIGAAYDTFGPFDDEINGRPNGLPLGVNDPNFTGFLRLEYALWHNQTHATLVAVVARLDDDVRGLQAAFPHQLMLNTDLPLRAHEILENALQFELTGETDQGSNTNLATALANVKGTETTVSAIAPLLEVRNPALLNSVDTGLGQLATLLGTYDKPPWPTPLQSLTQPEREQLDGAFDALLEQLSTIPDQLRLFAIGAD